MQIPNVNLDEVEGSFELIDPGIWPAEIKTAKTGKSKASGEPKLMFVTELLDGPQVGKKVAINLSLQTQALWKFRQLRDVCGVPSTGGDFVETDDFVGRRLKLACSHKEFTDGNGQTTMRTQVDDFLPYE